MPKNLGSHAAGGPNRPLHASAACRRVEAHKAWHSPCNCPSSGRASHSVVPRGGLKNAARIGQMAENVFFLPVWRKPIDSTGWRCPRPWPLIAHIGPDPASLETLTKALVTQAAIQHPDRRVVRMQQIAGHDVGLKPLDQRLQGLHVPPAPADERAFGNISSHAGADRAPSTVRISTDSAVGSIVLSKCKLRPVRQAVPMAWLRPLWDCVIEFTHVRDRCFARRPCRGRRSRVCRERRFGRR